MMDLKLWLLILMVCGMAESKFVPEDWMIKVPSTVSVLESQCAFIPCIYAHPTACKRLKTYRAFWIKEPLVVASNIPEYQLAEEFRGRTRMIGSAQSGNCTWQLNDARIEDAGLFYVRIEIPTLDSLSYYNYKVTLDVFKVPKRPEITVDYRDKVFVTCKVTHVCPASPPNFSWSLSGTMTVMTKREDTLMWSTTSTITFILEEALYYKPIECTVKFLGGKTTKGSKILSKYRSPVYNPKLEEYFKSYLPY